MHKTVALSWDQFHADTRTLATRLAAIRIARQPARIRELGFWQQPTSKGSNQADVRDAAGKS